MYVRWLQHPAMLLVEPQDPIHEFVPVGGFELQVNVTYVSASHVSLVILAKALQLNLPFRRHATFLFLGLSALFSCSNLG